MMKEVTRRWRRCHDRSARREGAITMAEAAELRDGKDRQMKEDSEGHHRASEGGNCQVRQLPGRTRPRDEQVKRVKFLCPTFLQRPSQCWSLRRFDYGLEIPAELSGKKSEKHVSSPGELCATTRPPWADMIERTIARPRPDPPSCRARPASSRWKRSNTRSSWDAGIPSPWLDTVNTVWPGIAEIAMCTRVLACA